MRSSCSKPSRVDDAVRAFSLELSAEEVAFLEEPYVAHDLADRLARPSEKARRGDGRSATAGTEERMTTRAQSAAGNEVEDYLASIPPTARPRLDTARPALTGLTLADHANCALRQLGTEPSRAHSDSPSRDSEQTPGRFRTSSHRS